MNTKECIAVIVRKFIGEMREWNGVTNFVRHLKDRTEPHQAVDTDNENSTFKRYHAEAAFADLSGRQCDDTFQAEKLTPDNLLVLCPPNSTDSHELRQLADAADFAAERHHRGQVPQRDHATAEHRPANNPRGAGQAPLPPGTGIRM